LTLEAADILGSTREVYLRSSSHPAAAELRAHLPETAVHSFDDLLVSSSSLNELHAAISGRLADLARRAAGVVYGVTGGVSLGHPTVRRLLAGLDGEVPVRIVHGVSYVETMLNVAGVVSPGWVEILDAAEIDLLSRENALGEAPGTEERLPWRAPLPTVPMLVTSMAAPRARESVERWLTRYYPPSHPVMLLSEAGAPQPVSVPLGDLREESPSATCLYIPPLTEIENVRTFSGLMNLTRTLRAPGGCPWDREQTHASLKPHLIEEAYEVVDALDSGVAGEICEELGDLLFQIAIHTQVAAEAEEFTIEDVIGGIVTKLIGRHPHVFGDVELESSQDVLHAWESLKQKQKPKRLSIMEGIPRGMPALPQSNLMQKRAAGVGFEWPDVAAVFAKVEEELDELREEIDRGAPADLQREELGDILFALVSVARHLRIDPEEALRLANRKFAARFQYVESRAAADGVTLRELSPEGLDTYWNEAKSLGTSHLGTSASD
jgi:tetrapyrrole methylase family protein/MazG family protein